MANGDVQWKNDETKFENNKKCHHNRRKNETRFDNVIVRKF